MIGDVGHCLMDGVYHNLKGQGYPQKPDDRWEKSGCRINPNAAGREGPRFVPLRVIGLYTTMILLDTPDWRSVL